MYMYEYFDVKKEINNFRDCAFRGPIDPQTPGYTFHPGVRTCLTFSFETNVNLYSICTFFLSFATLL